MLEPTAVATKLGAHFRATFGATFQDHAPANSTAMAATLGPPHFRAFGVNFGVKVGAQFGVYTFSDPTLAPLGSRFGAHSSANFDNCFHATFAARLGAHSPNVDAIFGATLEPHFMA